MADVIPLHSDDPQDDPHAVLDELLKHAWIQLIRDMDCAREDVEGAGGSSKPMTTAERARILSSASDYLLKRQKHRPSKSRSGIADLAAQHRESPGRTRRR
jgi:hypothetical protein